MSIDPIVLEQHFGELAERPVTERIAAVQSLAREQPELAARLAALLDAHGQGGDLEAVGGRLFDALGSFEPSGLLGRELDGWRLTTLLGQGGMGVVYAAEREDEGVVRQAAVKLLAIPMFDIRAGERFIGEARLLARLEHPGICRLLGWGRTEEQWPYLVLDLVRGEPLDRFAGPSIPLRQRLGLMIQVADAVAAAHRQLVAHLDLKPANVLVVDRTRPVLLDFGIARALNEERAGTVTMTRWLTPDYASPEQLRGEAASAAADVYALGALLYELLAGKRPFDLSGCPITEALSRIERGAEPPSRVTSGISRDLDAICARAMHVDPARRYASADAFADDLRAVLEARPVRARPDSLGYRLRKLGQRHPVAVPASALGVLSVAVLAGLLAWQAGDLREQRDLAEREAARARSASELLLDSIRAASPGGDYGKDVKVADLLDITAARAGRELVDTPLLHADALLQLADVRSSLGQPALAIDLYEQALAIYTQYPGDNDRRVVHSAQAGLAEALRAHDRVDEAQQLAEASLVQARDADGGDGALGRLWLTLGRVRQAQSEYDSAEAAYEQSLLEIPEDDQGLRAQALVAMGAAMSARSREGEALEWYQRALDVAGAVPEERVLAASIREEIAYSLSREERHEEALDSIAWVRAQRDEIFGPEHPIAVGTLTTELLVLDAAGRWEEALEVADRAIALEEAISGGESRRMERLLTTKGVVLRRLGRSQEAFPLHERALALAERHYPPVHRMLANAHVNLGVMHADVDDYAASEVHTRRAWEVFRDLAGDGPPLRGGIIAAANLANCMHKLGRPDEGAEWAERALEDAGRVFPAESSVLPQMRNILARNLLAAGRLAEAEHHALEVRRRYEALSTPVQPSALRNNAELLAEIYDAFGNGARAGEYRELAALAQPPTDGR